MERTLDQDVAYGLRLLVDMAERRFGLPWQDPTTAVQAIDGCTTAAPARRRDPGGRHRDEDGGVAADRARDDLEAYIHLAFDEIRLAVAGSPQVGARLRRVTRPARHSPSGAPQVLDEHSSCCPHAPRRIGRRE